MTNESKRTQISGGDYDPDQVGRGSSAAYVYLDGVWHKHGVPMTEEEVRTAPLPYIPACVADALGGSKREEATPHTTGPWTAKPHPDKRRNEAWVTAPPNLPGDTFGTQRIMCELHGCPDHHDAETIQANARRIVECVNACEGINPAAVPKLLAACKEFVRFSQLPSTVDRGDYIRYQVQAIGAAKDAIAEATTENKG